MKINEIKNLGKWLVVERLLRLANGIIIYAAIAKHLGPSDFGNLNVAIGMISILSALPSMGAEHINISEIKRKNTPTKEFIGSAILVRLALSIPSLIGAAILCNLYKETAPFVIALLIQIPISALSISNQKLQADGNFVIYSKYSCCSIIISAGIKILGLLTEQPAIFFAWTIPLEPLLLLALTIKHSGGSKFFISCGKNAKTKSIKLYLRTCQPLTISSVLVAVYFKIEIILISDWINDAAAGQWSLATLTITPWMLAAAAVFPIINNQLASKNINSNEYRENLKKAVRISLGVGILAIIANYFFYKHVLTKIMGEGYQDLELIVAIASVSIIPMLVGGIQEISIAHRRFTGVVLKKVLIGIPLSITLLKIMTLNFGILGAALSVTASYIFTALVLNCFFDKHFHKIVKESFFIPR